MPVAPIRVLISSVPMKYFIRSMWLKEFVYICRKKKFVCNELI